MSTGTGEDDNNAAQLRTSVPGMHSLENKLAKGKETRIHTNVSNKVFARGHGVKDVVYDLWVLV